MIVRAALAVLLLAAGIFPAWGLESCRTTVDRNGHARLVMGTVDGNVLKSLLIEDEDIFGKLTMDPGAVGYTASGGGAVSLTPYRGGQSVEGKDWHQPGSVETTFSGMALHWPRFYKDGMRISTTKVVFNANGLGQGIIMLDMPSRPDAETIYVTWDRHLPNDKPYDHYRTQGISDGNEHASWSNAPNAPGQLRVEFYEEASRTSTLLLATTTFDWPDSGRWNTRLISQVNALRKLHTDRKCTLVVPPAPPSDDDDYDGLN